MKALLEDLTTGGGMPVEVKVMQVGDKTKIAFWRKDLNMVLTVYTDDIASECGETDDGR